LLRDAARCSDQVHTATFGCVRQAAGFGAEDSTVIEMSIVNKGLFAKAKDVAHWRLRRALAVASLTLQVAGDAGRLWGRYDGGLVTQGEYWRLVTAHVVHLGWGHLWPNLTALVLIGALFEDLFDARMWLLLAAAAAGAIDLGLLLLNRDVDWYVGLSGVLHGFVAAGALTAWLRGQSIGWLLAIGLAAKLVWEQAVGPVPFTAAAVGGPVVVASHLYGTAGGLLAAAATHIVRARRARV
jgi:rhomboid family GlyGly-CTERM serine protease